MPKVDATKCPKLDRVVKGSITKDTKEADANLAKIQTLVLDAVSPLVHIIECSRRGQLTNNTSEKASKLALRLIANESAHIAKERRKNALKDLNRDLLTLVEDNENLRGVAPMLFGDGFEKTMKEHIDAMQSIRKTSSGSRTTESFFSKEPPHGAVQQQPLPWGQLKLQWPWLVSSVPWPHAYGKRKVPQKESAEPDTVRSKTLRIEQKQLSLAVPHASTIYAYANIPVVSLMQKHCCQSMIVDHLWSMGIVPVTQTLVQ